VLANLIHLFKEIERTLAKTPLVCSIIPIVLENVSAYIALGLKKPRTAVPMGRECPPWVLSHTKADYPFESGS
jgi:hypothetical protein